MNIWLWQLFLVAMFCSVVYSLYKLIRAEVPIGKKIIWCLIILFLPVFGGVFYLLLNNKLK
ncbi:PLDc N-terminal domain-containing protein [Flavobacterium sp. HSC-61S13]|uniref:PLDc N-terminal domain-containing protein n=1 Tax=Flavobacterium sp. HSC-61S13 TaxID=2910963 RepID=UPI003531DD0F|nr:hypothetical protein [Flavobacterium sp. HSC-61S13]